MQFISLCHNLLHQQKLLLLFLLIHTFLLINLRLNLHEPLFFFSSPLRLLLGDKLLSDLGILIPLQVQVTYFLLLDLLLLADLILSLLVRLNHLLQVLIVLFFLLLSF